MILDRLRKEKLVNYLYPTVEIAEFLVGDLYVELSKVLPIKVCFSNCNLKTEIRKSNYEIAKNVINAFIDENPIYKTRLEELYYKTDVDSIIKDLIIGYVFYLTPHINKYTGADVFADRRSICYSKISILDYII